MSGIWNDELPRICKAQVFSRYKQNKYNGSEEQMSKYTLLLSAYGVGAGIDFKYHGRIANTLDAHRLIQHYQEESGAEVADKIVNCRHSSYEHVSRR